MAFQLEYCTAQSEWSARERKSVWMDVMSHSPNHAFDYVYTMYTPHRTSKRMIEIEMNQIILIASG